MKTKLISLSFIAGTLILSFAFTSCKKKKNTTPDPPPQATPAPSTKIIKYEITGNYSGHLLVVVGASGTNGGGNETIEVTSLPWSKTVEYDNTILGVGMSAGSINEYPGSPGQTVSIKIYHGTNVVKSGNGSIISGVLILPTLSYLFP